MWLQWGRENPVNGEAHLPLVDGAAVPLLIGELDAVASGRSDRWRDHWQLGQDWVDLIRHGLEEQFQELSSLLAVRLFHQLGHSELAGAFNNYEEVEFTFLRSFLGDILAQEANRVSLEPLSLWLVATHLRKTGDAMSLETSMLRRACEMRDRRGLDLVLRRGSGPN